MEVHFIHTSQVEQWRAIKDPEGIALDLDVAVAGVALAQGWIDVWRGLDGSISPDAEVAVFKKIVPDGDIPHGRPHEPLATVPLEEHRRSRCVKAIVLHNGFATGSQQDSAGSVVSDPAALDYNLR